MALNGNESFEKTYCQDYVRVERQDINSDGRRKIKIYNIDSKKNYTFLPKKTEEIAIFEPSFNEKDEDILKADRGIPEEMLEGGSEYDDILYTESLEPPRLLREEKSKSNTSYMLTDIKQLDELINRYDANKSKLTFDEQEYYNEFISKYNNAVKENDSDILQNPDILKGFLALKKIDKYNYNTNAISKIAGRVNEDTNMLGQYCGDLNLLKSVAEENLSYKNNLENFYEQLYKTSISSYCCLLDDDKELIEKYAKQMLEDECNKWGDTADDLYTSTSFDHSATYINDTDSEYDNWNIQILVYENGLSDLDNNKYLPQSLIVLHEFYHVKQIVPGVSDDYFDRQYMELGATIDTIVRADEIHKEINGIDISNAVEYPKEFISSDGKTINMGELINEFRCIKEKYDLENYEQVLMTKEGIEFVNKCFGGD